MCRTCLRSPNKLFDIRNDDSLIEKIETIASIQVRTTNFDFLRNSKIFLFSWATRSPYFPQYARNA